MTEHSEEATVHQTTAWYFRDVYWELVDNTLERELYNDDPFSRGRLAELRSILYLLHQQAISFGVDLFGMSRGEFDIAAWLESPFEYWQTRNWTRQPTKCSS